MSHFDDVIEPSLFREPVYRNTGHSPTVASKVEWRGKGGFVATIGDMSDRHLNNAHNLLGSRIGTETEKPTDLKYYGLLRAEINQRNQSH